MVLNVQQKATLIRALTTPDGLTLKEACYLLDIKAKATARRYIVSVGGEPSEDYRNSVVDGKLCRTGEPAIVWKIPKDRKVG